MSDVYWDVDYTFDVIAVSETWMSHNSNNFNIPGYDAYHIVRENKKGGGVACYVKQELTSMGLTSKSMVVDDVFECTTIEIQVSGYSNIIVSCIGPRVQM